MYGLGAIDLEAPLCSPALASVPARVSAPMLASVPAPVLVLVSPPPKAGTASQHADTRDKAELG